MISEIVENNAGPIFVVGVPRSGTKLLRALLNNHPAIRFPEIESEFFPYWVENWGRYGKICDPAGFESFCSQCRRLPFFVQLAESGHEIDCMEWFDTCEGFSPAEVFEALMQLVLVDECQEDTFTWGDKSPSYILHVPLLIKNFPNSKIIHIIRDARDCSLSSHKAWGKSMLRAAQRWHDDVSKCREDGQQYPSSYLELRYEDLLADCEKKMRGICEFLGVEFDPRMLSPGMGVESIGDAKGKTSLLASNVGKYEDRMSRSKIDQIERIAGTTLREMGYHCTYAGAPVRLSRARMLSLQLIDAINLVRSSMKKRGLLGAFLYQLEYFRTSGNRVR